MNIIHLARGALFSIPLLALSPIATSAEVYDVNVFDVNGVSLGDDAEKVINAFVEFYSVTRDELDIEMSTDLGRKEKTIAYVDYQTENIKVRTIFAPIGGYKGNLEVDEPYFLAKFNVSIKPKFKNYKEYAEKFVEKYGAPTFVLRDSRLFIWCEKLSSDKTTCDNAHPKFSISDRSFSMQVAEEINK